MDNKKRTKRTYSGLIIGQKCKIMRNTKSINGPEISERMKAGLIAGHKQKTTKEQDSKIFCSCSDNWTKKHKKQNF